MHLGIVLGDLDPAVWLALDEEQWQLELLIGVGSRAVNIKATFLVVEQRIGNFDVSFFELGNGHLLLDELEEQLLLVTDPLAQVE